MIFSKNLRLERSIVTRRFCSRECEKPFFCWRRIQPTPAFARMRFRASPSAMALRFGNRTSKTGRQRRGGFIGFTARHAEPSRLSAWKRTPNPARAEAIKRFRSRIPKRTIQRRRAEERRNKQGVAILRRQIQTHARLISRSPSGPRSRLPGILAQSVFLSRIVAPVLLFPRSDGVLPKKAGRLMQQSPRARVKAVL